MENIKGTIEEKSIKDGVRADKVTPWKRATFKVSGKILATFDEEIITKFNPGMVVDVDYEVNEKDGKHYNNIQTMKPFSGTIPLQTAAQFQGPEDVGLKIIRQSCLKASASILGAIKDTEKVQKSLKDGKFLELFLATTDALVHYVQHGNVGDVEREEPKEEVKEEKVDEKVEDPSMPDY